MAQMTTNSDPQYEARKLLSKAAFPEDGKKVLRAMNEMISALTRENRQLKRENTELQILNKSLQKLMKKVESQLNQWRGSYMRK